MSESAVLFVEAELTPSALAEVLAGALPDLRGTRTPDDEPFLARDLPDQQFALGGVVADNDLANAPADDENELPVAWQSAYDEYRLLWALRGYGTGEARERLLEQTARRLFEDVVAATDLQVLLVCADHLVALRLPGQAPVWFPDGTTPDEDSRDLWLPHRVHPGRHGPYPR